jgi:chlorobactene glucosyltransferase
VIHAILVGAVLVGLGVIVLLLVILAATPRLSRVRVGGNTPPVSIVIPARNEERGIAEAVSSHLAQDYPDFEVIVVDDGSTDRTGEILESLARADSRLRVIAGTDPPGGWIGKPHALFQGARAATGEVLLFADADVRYDRRALAEAVALLESEGCDFLGLLPRFEAKGFWENVLMPNVPCAYYFGPGLLANLDRPRWMALGGGAGILVRRPVYDAVGGHEALKNSVVDDVRLAFLVKRSGFRTLAARAEDRVSVRMYRGLREVFEGFTKNVAYLFTGPVGLALLALTAGITVLAILPPIVLLAGILGVPAARSELGLAGLATAVAIGARAILAAALGDAVWPALTHPIMTATWAAIIGRSLYVRLVRRRLTWRGRHFDARAARF